MIGLGWVGLRGGEMNSELEEIWERERERLIVFQCVCVVLSDTVMEE